MSPPDPFSASVVSETATEPARWEAVLVALFGSALGLAIGSFFGWAIVRALADKGFTTFTIPVGPLGMVTLIAVVAGVAGSILPARRAARLDVLDAIATAWRGTPPEGGSVRRPALLARPGPVRRGCGA